MFSKLTIILLVLVSFLVSFSVLTQEENVFHQGPVMPGFGNVASVDSDMVLDSKTELKLCFDVAEQSGSSINRTFDSAARFTNLNVESGADANNISVAIVIHGSAAIDVTKSDFYANKNGGKANPNVEIISELQKNRTTIYLCGQTAAWRGIGKNDLLPGVKMAPSAMTAHALLQQDGFSLCPF